MCFLGLPVSHVFVRVVGVRRTRVRTGVFWRHEGWRHQWYDVFLLVCWISWRQERTSVGAHCTGTPHRSFVTSISPPGNTQREISVISLIENNNYLTAHLPEHDLVLPIFTKSSKIPRVWKTSPQNWYLSPFIIIFQGRQQPRTTAPPQSAQHDHSRAPPHQRKDEARLLDATQLPLGLRIGLERHAISVTAGISPVSLESGGYFPLLDAFSPDSCRGMVLICEPARFATTPSTDNLVGDKGKKNFQKVGHIHSVRSNPLCFFHLCGGRHQAM